MRLQKPHIIIGLIIAIAVVGILWFFLRPQAKIVFNLAPETVTMVIDNKTQMVTNNQTLTVKPGSYTLTFSRKDFSTEKKTIKLKNRETFTLTMALTPQTDAARKIISDNAESVKITAEYKKQKKAELVAMMPINATGFSIDTCPSIKYPTTDAKAFCIKTTTPNSERLGRLYLKELGYNLDDLEILVGSSNLMTLLKKPNYKVEAYITDTSAKPILYITPLNVPYVSIAEPYNEQLESIRSTSLADLEAAGYARDNYEIIFSNIYLTRYNADDVHTAGSGHELE